MSLGEAWLSLSAVEVPFAAWKNSWKCSDLQEAKQACNREILMSFRSVAHNTHTVLASGLCWVAIRNFTGEASVVCQELSFFVIVHCFQNQTDRQTSTSICLPVMIAGASWHRPLTVTQRVGVSASSVKSFSWMFHTLHSWLVFLYALYICMGILSVSGACYLCLLSACSSARTLVFGHGVEDCLSAARHSHCHQSTLPQGRPAWNGSPRFPSGLPLFPEPLPVQLLRPPPLQCINTWSTE